MRYCLANYILSVTPNDPEGKIIFGDTFKVGGTGTTIGSIDISLTDTLWTTRGFPTGGWVHEKNLSRVGTIQVTLNQLAKEISKFKSICNVYYESDYEGFTLSLTDTAGRQIASAIDCYITKIPDQNYQESSSNQTWSFTSGKITFND